MEACYGGADVMERSCTMARGKDINKEVLPGRKICSNSKSKRKN
jgi:hypothetical protein